MTDHKRKKVYEVVYTCLGDLFTEDDEYAEFRLLSKEEKHDIAFSVVEELEEYDQKICACN